MYSKKFNQQNELGKDKSTQIMIEDKGLVENNGGVKAINTPSKYFSIIKSIINSSWKNKKWA